MLKIHTTLFCCTLAISIFSQNFANLKIANKCCNGDDGINCLTLIIEQSDGSKYSIDTEYDFKTKQNGIAVIKVSDIKKTPIRGSISITYKGKTLHSLKLPLQVAYSETYSAYSYKIDSGYEITKANQLCDEKAVIKQELDKEKSKQNENKNKKKSTDARAVNYKHQIDSLIAENESLHLRNEVLLNEKRKIEEDAIRMEKGIDSLVKSSLALSDEMLSISNLLRKSDLLIKSLSQELLELRDTIAILNAEIGNGNGIINSLANYLIPNVISFEWTPFDDEYRKKAKKISEWGSLIVTLKIEEGFDSMKNNLFILVTTINKNSSKSYTIIKADASDSKLIKFDEYIKINKSDMSRVTLPRIVGAQLLYMNPYNKTYKSIYSFEYLIENGKFGKADTDKVERKDYVSQPWENLDYFINY